VAVAGFALAPRPALITTAFVATAAFVDPGLLANSPTGQLAVELALLLPVLLLFGRGAMALRYLLNAVKELRAARAEIAQQAADRERARIARDLHDLLGDTVCR
jgi:two-component system, NarL family, sensor histidine kinase DesK